MTRGSPGNSFRDLSRLAALILGLATFVWGLLSGTDLVQAVFKAVVVYLVVSILVLIVNQLLGKLTMMTLEEEIKAKVELEAAQERNQRKKPAEAPATETVKDLRAEEGE